MALFGTPDTTSTSTNSNVDWLQPYWQSWLTNLSNITPASMPVYGGPTVAPLSGNQQTAIDMARQFATNGTPAGNAANGAITSIAGGVANPYAGNNPELQNVIDASNGDIAKAYSVGTAAQTDAAAARGGAYGGSAYNELTGINNQQLAKTLAQNTSNLRYQNYQDSANLFNQDRAAQLQAAGLGLNSQGADMAAINGLMNAGGVQQGNTQSVLDAMNNQFNQQTQAPFVSSSILGNGLSQAGGAPASSTTTQGGSSPSLAQILLGLGSAGYGIFG